MQESERFCILVPRSDMVGSLGIHLSILTTDCPVLSSASLRGYVSVPLSFSLLSTLHGQTWSSSAVGCVWSGNFIVALTSISLIPSEARHLYRCLFAFELQKGWFTSLHHFSVGLFGFFFLNTDLWTLL